MFEPLSQLYSLKPETDEEIAEKERLMEEALENASAVPLQIMEKCGRAIELSVAFAKRGSRIAVSDAGSSAILCKAAPAGCQSQRLHQHQDDAEPGKS